MTDLRDYDDDTPVGTVITKLLLAALPTEVRASAQDLVDRVAEHPEVEAHMGKTWGDLSEADKNAIAREVGLVARDVTGRAGRDTQSGEEHLH
jgi:hypothetical protein